jgi:hypothetical protein
MRRLFLGILILFFISRPSWGSVLLLADHLSIPNITVLSKEATEVRFVYGQQDHVYHLRAEYFQGLAEATPEGYTDVHPTNLPGTMYLSCQEHPGVDTMTEPPPKPADPWVSSTNLSPTLFASESHATKSSAGYPMRGYENTKTHELGKASPLPGESLSDRERFSEKSSEDTRRYSVSSLGDQGLPPATLCHRFFWYGNIGAAAYAMRDINQWIGGNNRVFSHYNLAAEPEISQGFTFGTGLGFWISNYFSLGAELCGLEADTSGGANYLREEMSLGALEIGGFVKAATPLNNGVYIAFTLGMSSLSLQDATIHDYVSGYSDRYLTLIGSALSVKTAVSLEYLSGQNVGVGLDLGYRSAKITNVKGNNGSKTLPLVNADRTPLSIDYSGFYILAGVRIYMP